MSQLPPKSIRDAEKASKTKELAEKIRIERNLKIENVLKSQDGRDVIASILIRAGVFDDKWTGNSEMFRHAGMRSIGLWLRDWIMDANLDSYFAILKELQENDGKGNTNNR